jgi:hypothetical protein
LLEQANDLPKNLSRLYVRARKAGMPVIFVNDKAGLWTSERSAVLNKARTSNRGKNFAGP